MLSPIDYNGGIPLEAEENTVSLPELYDKSYLLGDVSRQQSNQAMVEIGESQGLLLATAHTKVGEHP
jgi:hypothetical protein